MTSAVPASKRFSALASQASGAFAGRIGLRLVMCNWMPSACCAISAICRVM
jgi:hypothetical protein